VPDRNGKIFYTSITSLSHISKGAGLVDIARISINGRTFSITGYTASPEAVAEYKSRLSASGVFYDIAVQEIKSENNLYVFTLTGKTGISP